MLSVKPPGLVECYEKLGGIYSSLSDEIDRTQEVLTGVGVFGMDEIRGELSKAVNDMQTQQGSVAQLIQILDTACQHYDSCENRILDFCENSAVKYAGQQTAFTDLSAIEATLKLYELI